MSAFWQAVGFLTRFPVPAKAQTLKGWDNSPRYYPVVGLMLGAVIWLVGWLAELGFGSFGFTVSAVVIVASWIFLTGALHLDGWMDLADGLGSYRSRERMLEIMKDSRVGAMGVVAAIVLIGLKVAALQQLVIHDELAIVAMVPAVARFALLGVIYIFPYIQVQGLGTGLRQGVNRASLVLNLLLLLAVAYFIAGFIGWVAIGAVIVAAWLFGRFIVRKLGGFTGDAYGALVEAMETFMLLIILILVNHFG
ncbi:adenosylcobinamide-GDP ribazoletransferase [Cohnella herbarum]|uniref:Adenosylcobinamide-GDP ribazoletransferase n=1 Tax=Cohnella herbarum TaxID=2728023 RepID=A0A7Z2VFK2_9BACL|nr:adenosylcobinamide-GDP ribazoletransferase [Cohnella herbarum]QJD82141.1 adenosylcobinamide-GDP ribazoletransferase [Cohnella herbarum]